MSLVPKGIFPTHPILSSNGQQGLIRWRGGRCACTSLIRRGSLEELTVALLIPILDSSIYHLGGPLVFASRIFQILEYRRVHGGGRVGIFKN
jgi:hypothetical protein